MKKIVLGLVVFALNLSLVHAESYTLNYKGQVFTGDSVIHLKQEIKQKNIGASLQNEDLRKVVLHAKSAQGHGEAYVRVGNYISRIEQIDGSPYDFNTPGDFNKITFNLPNDLDGPWQIILKGKIKIKRVEIRTKDSDDNQGNFVTKKCTYLLETVWGENIKEFTATAKGFQGTGVQATACQAAQQNCMSYSFPLTMCVLIN